MSNKKPNQGLDPKVIEQARVAAAKYFADTNAASDVLIQQYEEINKLVAKRKELDILTNKLDKKMALLDAKLKK
jgi:hypothetical protein